MKICAFIQIGNFLRLDADHRTHAGHAVRPDCDDLAGALQTAVNAIPLPMRRGVALARRRAPVASQPGADEIMLGEKTFEVFVGRADVTHIYLPSDLAFRLELESLNV